MSASDSRWTLFCRRWRAIAYAGPEVMLIGAVAGALMFLGGKAYVASLDMKSISKQMVTVAAGSAGMISGATLAAVGIADCLLDAGRVIYAAPRP